MALRASCGPREYVRVVHAHMCAVLLSSNINKYIRHDTNTVLVLVLDIATSVVEGR